MLEFYFIVWFDSTCILKYCIILPMGTTSCSTGHNNGPRRRFVKILLGASHNAQMLAVCTASSSAEPARHSTARPDNALKAYADLMQAMDRINTAGHMELYARHGIAIS